MTLDILHCVSLNIIKISEEFCLHKVHTRKHELVFTCVGHSVFLTSKCYAHFDTITFWFGQYKAVI